MVAINTQPKFPIYTKLLEAITIFLITNLHLLVIVSTVITAYFFVQTREYLELGSQAPQHKTALRYAIHGGIVFGIGAILTWRRITPHSPTFRRVRPRYTNWLFVGIGMVFLGVLSEVNGNVAKIESLTELSSNQQLTLLIGGLGFLIWGLSGEILPIHRPQINWGEVSLVLAITALALIIRLWDLETNIHQFIDELNFAAYVGFFKSDKNLQLLRPEVRGFPTIFTYFQFQAVEIWGTHLSSVRVPSAVAGALTVPAVYLLGKSLFDRSTGTLAACLLAVFPPHVHLSQLALNNIVDPLFGTLAFAFVARGFRTNHRLDFAIGGVSLGLTQYFYEGGRLLYPPLMLVWFIVGFILWRPRPRIKGFLITALAAIVVAAPIYYTLYGREAPYTPRLDSERWNDTYWEKVSETEDVYLKHLKYSFLVYTTQPEWVALYYGGQTGLILRSILPLFLLGVAFVLWRFHRPSFLLVIWVLAVSIGNSLLRHNVLSTRYVVVLPALALLIAVGTRYTIEFLWIQRIPRLFQIGVLGSLAVVLMINQLDYYFNDHLPYYNTQIRARWLYDGEDALFRSANFPNGTMVYIISDSAINPGYGNDILQFLSEGKAWLSVLSPSDINTAMLSAIPTTRDNAFFVEPDDIETIVPILARYFELDDPHKTPYNIPDNQALVLYYARKQATING